MQKTAADGGIIICCDYCGRDWDGQSQDMIEGHRGSILCLECLRSAQRDMKPSGGEFKCTLCQREHVPAETPKWTGSADPVAMLCGDCFDQAARTFHKDPEVAWSKDDTDG